MSNGIGSSGGQLSDVYQGTEGYTRLFRKQNGFSPDQILKAKKIGNDIREKKITDKIDLIAKEEAAAIQADEFIRKLMTASQALSNPTPNDFPEEEDAFRSRLVNLTSSETNGCTNCVQVTSSAGAIEGSFSIKVARIASSDKITGSAALPSKTNNITANETRIYVSGTEIKIPAHATLEEISKAINIKKSDTHVQAFARKFSDTDYRIFMSNTNVGEKITFETIANKLTESFENNGTPLSLAGTLNIGGEEKVITPTMTLTDIAALIRTVPTFSATITGAAPSYTLSVTENGSPVVLTDVATENLMAQLGLAESTATSDSLRAEYYLDGLSTPYYSTTNHIEGLYDQTTIDLFEPTGNAEITVTITKNPNKVFGSIHDFVESYNELIKFAAAQTATDSTNGNKPKEGAFLAKNRDFIRMIDQIQKTYSDSFTLNSSGKTSALQIGINKDKTTGLLTTDASKLAAAVTANLDGVEQIFAYISENTTGGYFKTSSHPKQLPAQTLGKNIMVSLIKKADETYSARLYLEKDGIVSDDVPIAIGSTDITISSNFISIKGPVGSTYEGFTFKYDGPPIETPTDPAITIETQGFKVSQGLGDVLTGKLKDIVLLDIKGDQLKDQKNELNKVVFKTRSERLNQETRLKQLKERQAKIMKREERKAERFQRDMGKVQDIMAAFTPMMASMFGR